MLSEELRLRTEGAYALWVLPRRDGPLTRRGALFSRGGQG